MLDPITRFVLEAGRYFWSLMPFSDPRQNLHASDEDRLFPSGEGKGTVPDDSS